MNNNQFEKELVALQSNMRNFAFSLTLNRDDAEDLLQDTTLKVLDNQDKFTDNVNFKGWVLTIMKNIFINNIFSIIAPFLLAFAAGAMIYVVVQELIPESQSNKKKNVMALFTLIGFSIMMILDVAFG